MKRNWGALDVRLTDEDEAEVRRFLQTAEVAGHYMPPDSESYNLHRH